LAAVGVEDGFEGEDVENGHAVAVVEVWGPGVVGGTGGAGGEGVRGQVVLMYREGVVVIVGVGGIRIVSGRVGSGRGGRRRCRRQVERRFIDGRVGVVVGRRRLLGCCWGRRLEPAPASRAWDSRLGRSRAQASPMPSPLTSSCPVVDQRAVVGGIRDTVGVVVTNHGCPIRRCRCRLGGVVGVGQLSRVFVPSPSGRLQASRRIAIQSSCPGCKRDTVV
jgi:hypothetical protein